MTKTRAPVRELRLRASRISSVERETRPAHRSTPFRLQKHRPHTRGLLATKHAAQTLPQRLLIQSSDFWQRVFVSLKLSCNRALKQAAFLLCFILFPTRNDKRSQRTALTDFFLSPPQAQAQTCRWASFLQGSHGSTTSPPELLQRNLFNVRREQGKKRKLWPR